MEDSGGDAPPAPSDDPVGDTVASASALRSMASWDWTVPLAEDAIDHAGDVDVYRIESIVGVQSLIALHSEGGVDLNIRIIDAEERVLGSSSVMPYRAWGTDPGIWYQPRTDDSVFLEVSAAEGTSSLGSYQILGVRVDEEDAEPNDVDIDAVERLTEGSQSYRSSLVLPETHREFAGVMHAGGDVDLWVFDAPESKVVSWSMWEMASMVFDANMTLYDALMQPIAWASAPEFRANGSWYADVGILYPVQAGERYYLAVQNERHPSGAGTLYVGVEATEEPANSEVEPNDSAESPEWISLSESISHAGYASTTIVGKLDGEDEFDVFALSTEDVGGQYVSVHLQTGLVGSGLSARLNVTTDVAGTVVLGGGAVDSTGELSLNDLLVPPDAEGLFVVVEAFGRTDPERGNQFFLGLEQYPVPLHD